MAKVLIIDDNRKNSELLNDFVKAWGYETDLAYQGREAIEKAVQGSPDVILLDVMLPGMSGFEVCYQLKNNTKTKGVPVVMVTALKEPEDRVNGFAAGADNFLVKPINYKELKAILENLVVRKAWLDTLEERDIVLEEIFMNLGWNVSEDVNKLVKEKYKNCQNILAYLGVLPETKAKVLHTIKFQWLYKYFQDNEDHMERLLTTFGKLKNGCWLLPLLEYSCCSYKEHTTALKDEIAKKGLQLEADICFCVRRLMELLDIYGVDFNLAAKGLDNEAMQYGYPPKIVEGIKQELADYSIRLAMRLDLD